MNVFIPTPLERAVRTLNCALDSKSCVPDLGSTGTDLFTLAVAAIVVPVASVLAMLFRERLKEVIANDPFATLAVILLIVLYISIPMDLVFAIALCIFAIYFLFSSWLRTHRLNLGANLTVRLSHLTFCLPLVLYAGAAGVTLTASAIQSKFPKRPIVGFLLPTELSIQATKLPDAEIRRIFDERLSEHEIPLFFVKLKKHLATFFSDSDTTIEFHPAAMPFSAYNKFRDLLAGDELTTLPTTLQNYPEYRGIAQRLSHAVTHTLSVESDEGQLKVGFGIAEYLPDAMNSSEGRQTDRLWVRGWEDQLEAMSAMTAAHIALSFSDMIVNRGFNEFQAAKLRRRLIAGLSEQIRDLPTQKFSRLERIKMMDEILAPDHSCTSRACVDALLAQLQLIVNGSATSDDLGSTAMTAARVTVGSP